MSECILKIYFIALFIQTTIIINCWITTYLISWPTNFLDLDITREEKCYKTNGNFWRWKKKKTDTGSSRCNIVFFYSLFLLCASPKSETCNSVDVVCCYISYLLFVFIVWYINQTSFFSYELCYISHVKASIAYMWFQM